MVVSIVVGRTRIFRFVFRPTSTRRNMSPTQAGRTERHDLCADVSRKVLNKHYDLRTKEEARKQRRDELRKQLEGYEETSRESESDKSLLRREFPLFTDLLSAADNSINSPWNTSNQGRVMKGIVGYSVFVALLGLNFGLMGIGFDPIAFEITVNV